MQRIRRWIAAAKEADADKPLQDRKASSSPAEAMPDTIPMKVANSTTSCNEVIMQATKESRPFHNALLIVALIGLISLSSAQSVNRRKVQTVAGTVVQISKPFSDLPHYENLAAGAANSDHSEQQMQRSDPSEITVADLAQFASIGDPRSLDSNEHSPEAAIFSPDGEYAAVLIRRGDLASLSNHANLLLYRTADLMNAPQPVTLATFAASGDTQSLALVRWLADSQTIIFAASRGDAVPQIYAVNVRSHRLRQLTHLTERLVDYEITPEGRRLVALTQRPNSRAGENSPYANPHCRFGCRIAASNFYNAIDLFQERSTALTSIDLRTGISRDVPSPETTDPDVETCRGELFGGLSPDGRFALRTCVLRRVALWPIWWRDYTVDPIIPSCVRREMARCLSRLFLINLETGATTRLTDAPTMQPWGQAANWIDGGRNLILSFALEPLTDVDAVERAERMRSFAVLEVDPTTREAVRIARLDANMTQIRASGSTWNEASQTLTIAGRDANDTLLAPIRFRHSGAQWTRVAEAPIQTEAASRPIDLIIDQSINSPPRLIAVDHASGVRREILDPNPWLSQRDLGRIEEITWQASDGQTWNGGLYYPPHYQPGHRYPLLIQTHGFNPNEFSLDGLVRNYPGRAAAARGIMVLQVQEHFTADRVVGTPAEWPAVQAGYEGAIDHLDQLALINRSRVAIIGWSRTGPHAGYTLTHSNYDFAAAAFVSTMDFGYWYALLRGEPETGQMYGASTFQGFGLEQWLEYAPTFNLDRVRAPMLLNGGDGDITELWDWYSGLRGVGAPVEYWFSASAEHVLFRVPQILDTETRLVDWFDFWLNDHEDPDPAKAEQYVRWRHLREQRDALAATPRPPLLDWHATPHEQSTPH